MKKALQKILFIPLLLYISLDLLSSIYEGGKNKHSISIFVLPFIFPMLHLSYGTGMIYGYFKKIKKK